MNEVEIQKRRDYQRKYYQAHKEDAKLYQKEYNRTHKKSTSSFKGRCRVSGPAQPRRRLSEAVRASDILHSPNPVNMINSVLAGTSAYVSVLRRA